MEKNLLEINKIKIDIFLNVYYKLTFENTRLNEKNYESLKLLCPTLEEERTYYSEYFNKDIKNETVDLLENKLKTFKLLESLLINDYISLGEFIRTTIELEKKNNYTGCKTEINHLNKNINFLFFDTETTGLPKNYKAPYTDTNNWPRLVQLAYILCDANGEIQDKGCWIVKPNNFEIPKEASEIHRITNHRALTEGISLNVVLNNFNSVLNQTDYLVAHNISFDVNIIGAEFTRINIESKLNSIKKICTMEKSTNYCAIEGNYGFKWPKLSELHYKLFNTYFEEAHDAGIDIEATYRCFWELFNKKIIIL